MRHRRSDRRSTAEHSYSDEDAPPTRPGGVAAAVGAGSAGLDVSRNGPDTLEVDEDVWPQETDELSISSSRSSSDGEQLSEPEDEARLPGPKTPPLGHGDVSNNAAGGQFEDVSESSSNFVDVEEDSSCEVPEGVLFPCLEALSEQSSRSSADASSYGVVENDAQVEVGVEARESYQSEHANDDDDQERTDSASEARSSPAASSIKEEKDSTASPPKVGHRLIESDESDDSASKEASGSSSGRPAEPNAQIDLDKLAKDLDVSESEDEDIAEIFGSSDDEESAKPDASKDEAEDSEAQQQDRKITLDADLPQDPDFVSDFDMIMEQRKKERRSKRRHRNFDFINDSDERMNSILEIMNKAAKDDRLANLEQKPALEKRKLLPKIIPALKRSDWLSSFIDLGLMNSIAEWLQLLPDKSLPAYEVRHELLKLLEKFPVLDASIIRSSNIGKVIMLLYKHPKETRENKLIANKLICEWLRPILNLETNFSSLSREERMKMDYEHMPAVKKSRLRSYRETTDEEGVQLMDSPSVSVERDPIPRARVPKPSTKDYVIRPKWTSDIDLTKKHHIKSSAMDKKLREIKDRLKNKRSLKSVSFSISGSRV